MPPKFTFIVETNFKKNAQKWLEHLQFMTSYQVATVTNHH